MRAQSNIVMLHARIGGVAQPKPMALSMLGGMTS